MRTRVLVVVHSHQHEQPINISKDVLSIQTSKTTKGVGQLSLDIVPRKNYLNLVFPNDTINVYVDPGDGIRGFVRVFMGYVDRIVRSENTDNNGGISTTFKLACSDFQKVFERTNIHQNPHLASRVDLVDAEGTELLVNPGFALQTTGVIAHGTPADMIENLPSMLLGFGTQWALPASYNTTSKVISDNRQRRLNRSKARLTTDFLQNLALLLPNVPEALRNNSFTDIELAIDRANVPQGKDPSTIFNLGNRSGEVGNSSAESFSKYLSGRTQFRSYTTTLASVKGESYTLLDLIDFSFIEALSIDGYISNSAIWDKSGLLASIMRTFSNEMVNELIFDLRPVAIPRNLGNPLASQFMDRCFGDEYSTSKDELGYNHGWEDDFTGDFTSSIEAVEYVPAIVFREYPYSTVEGLDLGPLTSREGESLGFVPFGPIFSSQGSSDTGRFRLVYNYNDIQAISDGVISVSPTACEYSDIAEPLKHLDVVTIEDTDVINANVGRSDNDISNFVTMFAEDSMAALYKYIFHMFMPITNAVSIARNGLRVAEKSSRYANYDGTATCGSKRGQHETLRNMTRWMLLVDHWDQHNIEYLTGEITLRGMPEIRVGYRLDWKDRRESYYVESVSHGWAYGKEMVTRVQVVRGQRNDPFPSYVPPRTNLQKDPKVTGTTNTIEGGDRNSTGRLGKFFDVLDTKATTRSNQRSVLSAAQLPDEGVGNLLDSSNIHPDYSIAVFPGTIVYADSTLNVATVIPFDEEANNKLPSPVEKKEQADWRNKVNSRAFGKLSKSTAPGFRRYDDLFLNKASKLPGASNAQQVAFLRALSYSESRLNPNNSNGPAWGLMQVGIDGIPEAPPGTSGKVLVSYNNRFGTSYNLVTILDPEINVIVATELIARIVSVYQSVGLSPDWSSPDFVGFLVAGWNAGYSRKAGTTHVIEYLNSKGIPLTVDNLHTHAASAGATRFLSTTFTTKRGQQKSKVGWWKRVVRRYFRYLATDKRDGVTF
ncbi:MAG: lytic transglycosylase domain-containing protein [Sulfurovum sp.]|nr:lytic transglycosylase domain-containing protein [Sulfurovum sp.]